MKKLISICNLYILFWLIYNMQDMVFGRTGTIYATIILYVLIGISVYYTLYALARYKMPSYMKGLSLLVAMFTIYGLLLMLSGRTIIGVSGSAIANYNYIKQIYISLLPVFPFFVFTKQRTLNESLLCFWALLFLLLTIVSFFFTSQQYLVESETGAEEFTNNLGYVFLSLIPLLVFWKRNRIIQYLGLTIIMLFILLCFKRGAIIIGALCVVVFLFGTMRSTSRTKKTWVFLLSVVVILAGVYFVSNLIENSDYFNRRLASTLEGRTSGRDELYGLFWDHFRNELNPLVFLFGNGANATLTISDNYAHNDWLELAINQGLLGVLVYFIYWSGFYKSWKRSSSNSDIHLAIGISLILYFLKTFFSMTYICLPLYANICLGYCMAQLNESDISSDQTCPIYSV